MNGGGNMGNEPGGKGRVSPSDTPAFSKEEEFLLEEVLDDFACEEKREDLGGTSNNLANHRGPTSKNILHPQLHQMDRTICSYVEDELVGEELLDDLFFSHSAQDVTEFPISAKQGDKPPQSLLNGDQEGVRARDLVQDEKRRTYLNREDAEIRASEPNRLVIEAFAPRQLLLVLTYAGHGDGGEQLKKELKRLDQFEKVWTCQTEVDGRQVDAMQVQGREAGFLPRFCLDTPTTQVSIVERENSGDLMEKVALTNLVPESMEMSIFYKLVCHSLSSFDDWFITEGKSGELKTLLPTDLERYQRQRRLYGEIVAICQDRQGEDACSTLSGDLKIISNRENDINQTDKCMNRRNCDHPTPIVPPMAELCCNSGASSPSSPETSAAFSATCRRDSSQGSWKTPPSSCTSSVIERLRERVLELRKLGRLPSKVRDVFVELAFSTIHDGLPLHGSPPHPSEATLQHLHPKSCNTSSSAFDSHDASSSYVGSLTSPPGSSDDSSHDPSSSSAPKSREKTSNTLPSTSPSPPFKNKANSAAHTELTGDDERKQCDLLLGLLRSVEENDASHTSSDAHRVSSAMDEKDCHQLLTTVMGLLSRGEASASRENTDSKNDLPPGRAQRDPGSGEGESVQEEMEDFFSFLKAIDNAKDERGDPLLNSTFIEKLASGKASHEEIMHLLENIERSADHDQGNGQGCSHQHKTNSRSPSSSQSSPPKDSPTLAYQAAASAGRDDWIFQPQNGQPNRESHRSAKDHPAEESLDPDTICRQM